MAAKDVRFGDEVRHKMVNGVNILANAVKVTLGPKGQNLFKNTSHANEKNLQSLKVIGRNCFIK